MYSARAARSASARFFDLMGRGLDFGIVIEGHLHRRLGFRRPVCTGAGGLRKIQISIERQPAEICQFQLHIRHGVLQLAVHVFSLGDLRAHFGSLHFQRYARRRRHSAFR